MSTEWIVWLSALTSLITFIWARSMGEGWRMASFYGLLIGFGMPWGVGTLLWIACGGGV